MAKANKASKEVSRAEVLDVVRNGLAEAFDELGGIEDSPEERKELEDKMTDFYAKKFFLIWA